MDEARLKIEEESSIMEGISMIRRSYTPMTEEERLANQKRESIVLTETYMFTYGRMDKSKFIQQMRIVYSTWWQKTKTGKSEYSYKGKVNSKKKQLINKIFLRELIEYLEKGGDKDKERTVAALTYCKKWLA